MQPWLTAEDQSSGANVISVGTTSVQVLPARSGVMRRTQLIITNLTVGASMTVVKSDNSAVANQGIPLSTKQYYMEGDDGGFTCYQGSIQVVSDIPSSVSVVETLESRYS